MATPLEILYMALREPLGLIVDSGGDFQRTVQKLYQARYKALDPDLDCLQFRRSPNDPEGEVWIVNIRNSADGKE